MLDYESQRKLIVVFILATILIGIVTLVFLVYIWMPEPKAEESKQQFEVGKVTVSDSSEKGIVQKYYKEIYTLLLNNDIDSIYAKTGEDYLKFNNMDKEALRQFIVDKGVMSRGVELQQYQSYSVPGYTAVYELDLKVKEQAYSINVILREVGPDDYTIAFEKFIDCIEDVHKQTLNSVELDIYKRIRYTNSIQYEFKLTNNYDKVVKINANREASPVILVNTQSKVQQPIMSNMITAEFSLNPNEVRDCTAVFKIDSTYDYLSYIKMVIKGVEYTGITGTSNLEFDLM